jgi:xanthine dehydrogenase accessory factor
MAVSAAGDISGSVSGGCVEAAVAETALEVIRTGVPRLLEFGVADEDAWAVGLSCGGRIQVFVERVPEAGTAAVNAIAAIDAAVRADERVSRAVVVRGTGLGASMAFTDGGVVTGSLGSPARDEALLAQARGRPAGGDASLLSLDAGGDLCLVFVSEVRPRPELVIFGAVHIAVALVALARTLGFRTAVVDPRSAFATRERFADADVLLDAWPDQPLPGVRLDARSAVVVLSHDPKIDVPALQVALARPVAYVGALGSASTQRKRAAALAREGVTADQMSRLHAPIGLRIGARTPEEIALAILAEIVAVRHGGPAASGTDVPDRSPGQGGGRAGSQVPGAGPGGER